jgi:hypothetical protein
MKKISLLIAIALKIAQRTIASASADGRALRSSPVSRPSLKVVFNLVRLSTL